MLELHTDLTDKLQKVSKNNHQLSYKTSENFSSV